LNGDISLIADSLLAFRDGEQDELAETGALIIATFIFRVVDALKGK
jgi:hypothetical protein